MKSYVASSAVVVALGFAASANAACLTDAQVESAVGAQVRSKAMFITAPDLVDKPLCSGLTLAQQIQRMREAAFPDERVAREAEEARLRALQEAAPSQQTAEVEVRENLSANPRHKNNNSTMRGALAYFDGLIAEDAASWMMNRYDRGSMQNMKIIETSNGGRTKVVYGEYTYNGGASGWVKARFVNTKLQCLEFWDFSGQCRPLGHSPSQALAAGFAGSLAQGIMSDTRPQELGCNGNDCRQRDFVNDQQRDATYKEYHPDPK